TVLKQEWVVQDHERVVALSAHLGKGGLEIIRTSHLPRLKRHALGPCGRLHPSQDDHIARVGRIPEDRHARDTRQDLLEQSQPLHGQLREEGCESRDVPAWPREAGNEPLADGIRNRYGDDGYCRGCLLCGTGCGPARRDDEVYLEADQIGRQIGKSFHPSFCKPPLDHGVSSLDPTALTQPLPERLVQARALRRVRRGMADIANAVDLPRWLRPGGERRGEEAASGQSEERSPLHHSIT